MKVYSALGLHHCRVLLRSLLERDDVVDFVQPVDAALLELDDYHAVVARPMDLGTIELKLREPVQYTCLDEFVEDVRLVWSNARLYNPPSVPVAAAAGRMSSVFELQLSALVACNGSVDLDVGGGTGDELANALVRGLHTHRLSDDFRHPVDPVALKLPGYTEVVTRPMDLSTVASKLAARRYACAGELRRDLEQIWANALAFNGPISVVGCQAVALQVWTSNEMAYARAPLAPPPFATLPTPCVNPPSPPPCPQLRGARRRRAAGWARTRGRRGGRRGSGCAGGGEGGGRAAAAGVSRDGWRRGRGGGGGCDGRRAVRFGLPV